MIDIVVLLPNGHTFDIRILEEELEALKTAYRLRASFISQVSAIDFSKTIGYSIVQAMRKK